MKTHYPIITHFPLSAFSFASPVAPPLPLEKIPVNPHRLNAARVVRLGAVHQFADGINFQWVVGRPLQRHFVRLTARVVVFQPPAVMTWRDDDRHPVVQRRNRSEEHTSEL